MNYLKATLMLPIAVMGSQASSQASFTPVGDLTGGLVSSNASAISGDGTTVVGMSLSGNGAEAFRWKAGAITGLGDLPGFNFDSYARGVSFDGNTVVGNGSSGADGNVGFVWNSGNGIQPLRDLSFGTTLARAYAVSGNGQVAVGYGTSAAGREGARWTNGGSASGMGDFTGGQYWSEARATNADGTIIAGTGSRGTQFGSDAFRWTSANGFEYLGDLPGGNTYSEANGMSADGNTIVGTSVGTNVNGFNVTSAYRWTPSGGMVALDGLVPNGTTHAFAVSPDGSVVGGDAMDSNSLTHAVLWKADGTIINVKDALVAAGLATQLSGWSLTNVTGVANSQNGFAVVCGNGTNSLNEVMGWTAYVPLSPVPEPATLATLSLGGVALLRRRRKPARS